MRTFRYLLILLVIATLATMTLPAQAQNKTPPNVGLRPDAPTYALHGPYWVGTRDFMIEDATRPIPLTVWYPALNPKGDKEEITYTDVMIKFDAGIPAGEKPTLKGHALKEAAVDMSASPYPLILLSHGYGDWRTEYADLTEHLASFGFVVIAPDHTEFWTPEVLDLWKDTILRPQDMLRVIAYAETLTGTSGSMKGLIDMQQIGVMGHSYGGYTAMATAGARIDLDQFNALCEAMPEDSPDQGVCTPLVPHEAEMVALAGLDHMPTGLWPAWSDQRVKAVASFAGDAYLFGNKGLAEITVPVLAIGGTKDANTPPEWGPNPTYEHVSSAQKSLVLFENADHFIYTAKCDDEPWLTNLGFYGFCTDSVWDKARAHDLLNHFTTAFMLDVLKGDKEAHKALLPEAVAFAGIEYKTTMK